MWPRLATTGHLTDNRSVTWKFKEPTTGDLVAGRYRIEAEIGRGGFGIVFRASHTETQRLVAVKVLHSTFARSEPTAVERFRREAILSASLQYPNTVSLYDYGETEDGVFFIAMEYLLGTPLNHALHRAGQFSAQRALHITKQILFSLWEAHEKDIIHRDIKPENIMLTPLHYDQDFVKVMDFGIAKIASGSGPQITKAGQAYGTPQYMAPEQLQGSQISPGTDLYAVGLILYEMLVGKPAVKDTNLAQIISEVIFGPPVSLPESLDVPGSVRELVERACTKEVSRRYGSAREFVAAIERVEREERGLDQVPDSKGSDGDGPPIHEAATALVDPSILEAEAAAIATSRMAQAAVVERAPTDQSGAMYRYGCVGAAVLALLGWASVVLLAVILLTQNL
jgi:serine/threonine-protein kinase